MKKTLFVILGLIFFGLGAIGAVLPMLPTTPFLLLAAFCFTKGSKKFDYWFRNTNLYKNHLDSFVTKRSMTLKTKIILCSFATTMLLIAFILMSSFVGRVIIVCYKIFI